MSKTLLITGATGKQGGSLIDELLAQEAEFEILALTRDVNSASAQDLVKKSPDVKLLAGTLDEPETVFRNAKNVTTRSIWGVFSVQVSCSVSSSSVDSGWLLASGLRLKEQAYMGSRSDIEEKQGKALIDAALDNNVQYFVYTSADRGGDASLDDPTAVPHFISKYNIENHLVEQAANNRRENPMFWTILRPTVFFDNITPNFVGKVFLTVWKVVVKDKPLYYISVKDIGHFAALAFLNPDEYKGKCISLAGDALTFDEMAVRFKEKTGSDVPVTFEFIARFVLWLVPDLGEMFSWFNRVGNKADIQQLRSVYPGLQDVGAWLEQESGFPVKGR